MRTLAFGLGEGEGVAGVAGGRALVVVSFLAGAAAAPLLADAPASSDMRVVEEVIEAKCVRCAAACRAGGG